MTRSPDFDPARLVGNQRAYFHSEVTKPVIFRITQLKRFNALIEANESRLAEAMYADYRKSAFESFLTEFMVLYAEMDDAISRVTRWAAKKRVRSNLLNWPSRNHVNPEPLGVALVIGAWNY